MPLPVFQQASHHDRPTPDTTHWPAPPGRCQMDKPALGRTDFGKVKSPFSPGVLGWGGDGRMGESL